MSRQRRSPLIIPAGASGSVTRPSSAGCQQRMPRQHPDRVPERAGLAEIGLARVPRDPVSRRPASATRAARPARRSRRRRRPGRRRTSTVTSAGDSSPSATLARTVSAVAGPLVAVIGLDLLDPDAVPGPGDPLLPGGELAGGGERHRAIGPAPRRRRAARPPSPSGEQAGRPRGGHVQVGRRTRGPSGSPAPSGPASRSVCADHLQPAAAAARRRRGRRTAARPTVLDQVVERGGLERRRGGPGRRRRRRTGSPSRSRRRTTRPTSRRGSTG